MDALGRSIARGPGLTLLVAFFALLSAAPARAVLLGPGDIAALPGTTVAANPQLAGVVIVDELIPFSFSSSSGPIMGSVQQRIMRSSVDSTVDFYWQVSNQADSAEAIGSFRVGEFVSPEYDADYRTDSLGDVGPDSAQRFTSPFESYVNFNFSSGLQPGQASLFMFFDTTATLYDRTAFFDVTNIDQSHISGSFEAYSPSSAVPEPASIGLLGLGMIWLALRSRRTR